MTSATSVDISSVRFCPKCTSTNVRLATRSGAFQECLRLFWIVPFRCRACRHKFFGSGSR